MCSQLTKSYGALIAVGNFLNPFFLLAIRLFFGWQFFTTGLGKLGEIDHIADYFETLKIPAPLLNAYVAAGIEMVGGLLLLIGFASRLIAIPLMITMIVALFTAHFEVSSRLFFDPVKFVSLTAFVFFIASAIIFFFGPGPLSLDGYFKHLYRKKGVK